MEGASTLPVPIPGSPSRSAERKLPRRSAPKYSSCLLYNTQAAKEKLTGLSVATCNPSVEEDSPSVCAVEEPLKVSEENEKREYLVSDKMSCNFCQTEFAGRVEQKEHYKSDWHRFNLKQRIKGEFPVSEEAFEVLSGNISSLSGSDTDTDASDTETESVPRNKPLGLPARVRHSIPSGSDSDSESVYTERLSARKYPKVYMRNNNGELISLYRCVLHHKKCRPESHSALTSVASELPNRMTWAVLMAGGGHFAGAIFENGVIAQHKTFHRYVVRAKRGSAQGSRDSQGSAPKSGGASLRRYNEAALMQEIQELLLSWEDIVKKCDLIFLRAPSFNRQIFFGGKNPPLRKNDSRIRVIPFPTRRATYNEVRRVHEMLASIECYGEEEDIREFVPMSPRRHLSTDSGQLEPLAASDKSHSPKKKPSKSKTSLSPLSKSSSEENQISSAPEKSPSYPVLESLRERRQSQSSLGSSASDIDLMELQEEISTLDLKLFEATKKPRRRNPKKKRNMSPSHHQIEPESNILEEEKYHLKNTLYTACKTGDTDYLRNLLAIFSNPTCKTSPTMAKPPADSRDGLRENDKEHRTESAMLASEIVQHQASVNKQGLDKPAPVAELPSPVVTSEVLNEPIGDGKMTLLHVAAKEGHTLIIGLLLGAGADPSLRDRFGQTSYSCGKSKETRNEFRRFMAKFPDRYDYQKAEIPGPLTEDMEKERKQKEVERKKAQKKARQERLKDKREEDDRQRKEDAEKRRFLSLSDREKRALAAERRLLQSAESSGQSAPVLVRCWCCGADMTGKVPFEYSDYKFCSPKCLKQHRLDNSKKKSGS